MTPTTDHDPTRARRRVSTRALLLAGAVVALLVAGVVSQYASDSPDGLEHVATEKGFAGTATEHAASDSPLAEYDTTGVDDERLSGGIAGVVGTLLVLVLAGGVALVVRRRDHDRDPDPDAG